MSASLLPAIPALDNTFGACLIGIILAASLWGIGTAQCYWYFDTYRKDGPYLKSFVALVWVFDTVHQALLGHLIYFYLIQNYFNPLKLDHYVWSLNVQSLFEAFTCFSVQGFFVMRIFRLSRGNYFLAVPATIPVLAKLGLSLAYYGKGYKLESIALAFTKIHHLSIAINATAAAGDIVIAVTMFTLLYTSRSGFAPSDNMVNRLMAYTVNTGVITSLCAIITLIMAQTFPENFIYSAFYFLTGKLYLNTMLASLNARNSISTKGAVLEMSASVSLPRYQKKTETVTTYDEEATAVGKTRPFASNGEYEPTQSGKNYM